METRPIWVKYTDLSYDQKEWLNICKATWVNGYSFNYLKISDGAVILNENNFIYFKEIDYISTDFYQCKTGKEFCKKISEILKETFFTGVYIETKSLFEPHIKWLNENKITFASGNSLFYPESSKWKYVIFDGSQKNNLTSSDIPQNDIYTEYLTGTEFCQAVAEKLGLICNIPKEIHFSKMEVIDLNLSIPIENKPIVPKEQKFWVAWHPSFGFDLRYFSKISFPKKDLQQRILQTKYSPPGMEEYFSKLEIVLVTINPIIN